MAIMAEFPQTKFATYTERSY